MKEQIYSTVSFISACVSGFKGVRLPWIGSDKNPLYKEYKYHTGIDVYGKSVYTYAPGVVLAAGSEDGLYTVTVQYDAFSCLRYGHLSSVEVGAGDIIQAGSKIGIADKYLHFEYATKEKRNSVWPVRVGSQIYYKQDPALMIGVRND